MKLGTIADGTPDGALVVVDSIAGRAVNVSNIARNLQTALDSWSDAAPKLRRAAELLSSGESKAAVPINELEWLAPLPRAYQLLDGGGYGPHAELGAILSGKPVSEETKRRPTFYQSVSDGLLGPTEDILLAGEDLGGDFEAEIAVVVTSVSQGSSRQTAANAISLIGLMNDVSLRNIQRGEIARGFGFYQSKPKKAFAPFLVTPDELAPHWRDNILHLQICIDWNGKPFGRLNCGEDSSFDFSTLVAEASRNRSLTSGTIIAGGTVSNQDRTRGHCCIMEKRMLELIATGKEETPYLNPGDRIRIDVVLPNGASVFGAIDQIYRSVS